MDKVIFELKFIRKVMLAPITHGNGFDLSSSYMADLEDMDVKMYRSKRRRFSFVQGWSQERVVRRCHDSAKKRLKNKNICKNITDHQMMIIMEMMSFFLTHAKSCQLQNTIVGRFTCNHLLWQLSVFLLASNKKRDCKAWVREHCSELKTLRTKTGDSILHTAAKRPCGLYQRAPLVKLLVEVCQIDVNVQNIYKQTPLHLVCHNFGRRLRRNGRRRKKPTKDMKTAAWLLIYNGAHMDMVDVHGIEASRQLSKTCRQFSFNVNLKCLAAKAILKHGVEYENVMPKDLIKFIQSHKP